MTQEEKLEEAKRLYETANADQKYVLKMLFPELAESEDERIQKVLVGFFKSYKEQGTCGAETFNGLPTDNILAWLEKQGEKKPTIETITPEESLGIDSDTYNKIVDECIYGRQKPADKAEPKFKVGDFIVNDYCMGKVIELTSDAYLLDTGQGIPFSYEHNAHLWTIQDAKDGDVLVHNGCTFIFMGIKDDIVQAIEENILEPVSFGEPDKDNDYHPATKEQREILFQKMKEAGYTFDFEKKELKKIEPKTTAWTPMDEQRVENLLAIIEGHGYPGEVAWLNSLKDRVQPQPKQEWSREDSVRMDELCTFIQDYGDNFYCSSLKKIVINWLKSLRPQNRWKPSDEQMEALSIAMQGVNDPLFSLYQDLKKLKE